MPVLTWPADLLPSTVDFALRTNSRRLNSDLNNVGQTSELPGTYWMATLTFNRRQGAKARRLRGFLGSLHGPAGRFYLPVIDQATPEGSAQGVGLVSGAGQSGTSLVTSGWSPNQPGVLLSGEYFQVGNELKLLTGDAASNASGVATLQFTPPLRVSPANAAPIIVNSPACIMGLIDDEQTRWSLAAPLKYGFAIACREPLDL